MNKRIIAVALAIVMVCSLAGIGTMAWFTSSATSTSNEFKTGTLVLGSMMDGKEVENTFATVNFEDMEPGEPPVKVQTTTLRNIGTLPFYLYRITASRLVDTNAENGETDDTILNNVLMIRVTINENEVYYGRLSQMLEADGSGFFDPVYDVRPDEELDMVIEAFMDPNAGNTYQGLSMACDLTVYASQNNAPIAGQEGHNPVNLGTTGLFTASAENTTYGGEPWVKFSWDWDSAEWSNYTAKDELRLRIKHETGNPNAEVYEVQYSYGNEVPVISGLNQSDIRFIGSWGTQHDEIWVKVNSAAFQGWDTFAVEIGGGLNSNTNQLYETIPYTQWDLPDNQI